MSYEEGSETTVRAPDRRGSPETVRVFAGTGPPNPIPKMSRRPASVSGATSALTATREAVAKAVAATTQSEPSVVEEKEVGSDAT